MGSHTPHHIAHFTRKDLLFTQFQISTDFQFPLGSKHTIHSSSTSTKQLLTDFFLGSPHHRKLKQREVQKSGGTPLLSRSSLLWLLSSLPSSQQIYLCTPDPVILQDWLSRHLQASNIHNPILYHSLPQLYHPGSLL